MHRRSFLSAALRITPAIALMGSVTRMPMVGYRRIEHSRPARDLGPILAYMHKNDTPKAG